MKIRTENGKEQVWCAWRRKYVRLTLVYNRQMQPMMLMEFKADTVALTQRTLDQAAVYNRLIGAPYLILSNGRESIAARVEENTIAFMKNIPLWTEL